MELELQDQDTTARRGRLKRDSMSREEIETKKPDETDQETSALNQTKTKTQRSGKANKVRDMWGYSGKKSVITGPQG
eukprot:snap_masked-scaffold_27-processed-gene-4.38-mRNA-1 protein AED:1.00 eAED:1.00 QI:0/0/0/0/1/1/2/0/76